MQGSLFLWITLWHLCHTLNRCKVAYFHWTLHDSYSMQWRKVIFIDHAMKECEASFWCLRLCLNGVRHENKLPYICSMYDTGFKVLSMKINYLAPFKHKHKHQKFDFETCVIHWTNLR
jgi:hypothetical protein